jgi:hypothetical protein
MNKTLVAGVAALSVIAMVCGCAPNKKAIERAGKRIEALKSKGVSDSALAEAVVMVYQAKGASERNENSLARQSYDASLKLIAEAEAKYSDKSKSVQTTFDSLMAAINSGKAGLKGVALTRLDSMVRKADSFGTIGWIIQQEQSLRATADQIPSLKFNSERAEEVRPRVPGTWVCSQVTKSEADKTVHAVEDKVFEFSPDKTIKLTEKKKGQSGARLKEDWEFVSTGTYDIFGDTIYLFINRFKVNRQNFEEKFTDEKGKESWKKRSEPTYDSAITDGSQDRYIAFSDLKLDFSKR